MFPNLNWTWSGRVLCWVIVSSPPETLYYISIVLNTVLVWGAIDTGLYDVSGVCCTLVSGDYSFSIATRSLLFYFHSLYVYLRTVATGAQLEYFFNENLSMQ